MLGKIAPAPPMALSAGGAPTDPGEPGGEADTGASKRGLYMGLPSAAGPSFVAAAAMGGVARAAELAPQPMARAMSQALGRRAHRSQRSWDQDRGADVRTPRPGVATVLYSRERQRALPCADAFMPNRHSCSPDSSHTLFSGG